LTATLVVLSLVAITTFHYAVRWGVDWRIADKTLDAANTPNSFIGPALMLKHLVATVATLVLIILIVNGGRWPGL